MFYKLIVCGMCMFSLSVWADSQMEIMQDKVDRLEAELALVQRKIYQKTPAESTPNVDAVYTQMNAQNQVVESLTSKLEDMNHQIQELQSKLKRLTEDVDFRFQEMSGKSVSPAPVVSEVKTQIPDTEAYNNAYILLKDGQYGPSEKAFIDFMDKYPHSSLLGNANYWLGETYYARQQWPEAAGLFADGFTKYKDNSKAPDSMFKLGLTMKQMGQTKEACTAFRGLTQEFKTISENLKNRAQQEMKELKCP